MGVSLQKVAGLWKLRSVKKIRANNGKIGPNSDIKRPLRPDITTIHLTEGCSHNNGGRPCLIITACEGHLINNLWYDRNMYMDKWLSILTCITTLHITGFTFFFGTYVACKMQQFLKSPGTARTDIDELSLFEQRINLLNGYVVLMQLIRIWIPPNIGDHYLVTLFGLWWSFRFS